MRYVLAFLAAVIAPLAVSAAEPQPKPDEMVNNPPFAHWSSFAPGTTVTQKETVSLSDGSKVEQVITAKLLEKTKEHVVVETTVNVTGGGVVEKATTATTYPAKVKMSQADTPDSAMESITEGKEEVDVKGKKVTAEWVEAVTKNGDEVSTTKVWTAQDIPGGIIKQTLVRKKGDKVLSESVLELVEFKAGS
jgi:hypothetical protein